MKEKRETINLITESAHETSKVSAYDFLNTNRNSFDVLSEIGMMCGVFLGILGSSLILMSSFFGALEQLHNIGFILLCFSFVLLMNRVGNRYKIAEDKKSHP